MPGLLFYCFPLGSDFYFLELVTNRRDLFNLSLSVIALTTLSLCSGYCRGGLIMFSTRSTISGGTVSFSPSLLFKLKKFEESFEKSHYEKRITLY